MYDEFLDIQNEELSLEMAIAFLTVGLYNQLPEQFWQGEIGRQAMAKYLADMEANQEDQAQNLDMQVRVHQF